MTILLHLMWRLLRGRAVRWIRLLRQPKYGLGTLVGCLAAGAWIATFAVPGFRGGRPPSAGAPMVDQLLPAVETGAALVLLIVLALWWLWPFGRATLDLTETELHVLLPAPLRRRDIAQYALLRVQPGILLGSAIFGFVASDGSPARFAWRFVSIWLLLTLWHLHARARGLWIARLVELPRGAAWRRRAAVVAGVCVAGIAIGEGVVAATGRLPDWTGDSLGWIAVALDPDWLRVEAPALTVLLEPLRWTVAPVVAGVVTDIPVVVRLGWLVWLVLLVVLHNEWVVRSRARFEDASLARARRLAVQVATGAPPVRMAPWRRASAPFELPAAGRPEVAVIWKHLMLTARAPLRLVVGAGTAALVTGAAAVTLVAIPRWLAAMMALAGVVGLATAPMAAVGRRNDLRSDLLRLDLVRPWPIGGGSLFLAQVIPPAVALFLHVAAAGGLLFVAALATGPPAAAVGLDAPYPVALLLGLATLLITAAPAALLVTTLHNLATLTWPSWMQLGATPGAGSAARAGQTLLTGVGVALALGVGLLPGALLATVGLIAQVRWLGLPFTVWELPLVGGIAVLPLAIGIRLLVHAGGILWDRFDPSAELLSAGPGA